MQGVHKCRFNSDYNEASMLRLQLPHLLFSQWLTAYRWIIKQKGVVPDAQKTYKSKRLNLTFVRFASEQVNKKGAWRNKTHGKARRFNSVCNLGKHRLVCYQNERNGSSPFNSSATWNSLPLLFYSFFPFIWLYYLWNSRVLEYLILYKTCPFPIYGKDKG